MSIPAAPENDPRSGDAVMVLSCWIEGGIAEFEAYLAKHAAFLSFLDTADSTS